jgi:hypothetical protein
MSAVSVSRFCYDKYQSIAALPPNLRDDVDLLAGHFFATRQFESVFIGSLVPRNELVGEPNNGHAAVADFLISRAATAALSANFDPLIESWGWGHKIAMHGALTTQEAVQSAESAPLLKFVQYLVWDSAEEVERALVAAEQRLQPLICDEVDVGRPAPAQRGDERCPADHVRAGRSRSRPASGAPVRSRTESVAPA